MTFDKYRNKFSSSPITVYQKQEISLKKNKQMNKYEKRKIHWMSNKNTDLLTFEEWWMIVPRSSTSISSIPIGPGSLWGRNLLIPSNHPIKRTHTVINLVSPLVSTLIFIPMEKWANNNVWMNTRVTTYVDDNDHNHDHDDEKETLVSSKTVFLSEHGWRYWKAMKNLIEPARMIDVR